MLMFLQNQWVKCVRNDDPEIRGKKYFIFFVNEDGTGRARRNDKPSVVVTLDPSDCEPV